MELMNWTDLLKEMSQNKLIEIKSLQEIKKLRKIVCKNGDI